MSDIDPTERIRMLESQLSEVRREAASYRTGNRGVLAEVAKVAGLDTTKPDFDAAKELLQMMGTKAEKDREHAEEVRALKVGKGLAEGALRHGLKNLGVTRAHLIDSGAMAKLYDSVAKPDFEEILDTVLGETLEANPELRGGPPSGYPRKSSIEIPGGGAGGESPAYTRAEIAAMPPDQVVALRRAGKLGHLLGGS